VPSGGTATATFTVTTGSATGSYAVGISAAGASSALNVDVAAAGGVTPGAALTVGGVTYTWPDEQPGTLDSIWSAGQVIPLSLPSGSTRIGLLGSAIDAGSGGATGTLTVTYTDGSTQAIPVAFGDWTLGAGAFPPLAGDTIAATPAYRNLISGGSQPVKSYIYGTSAALESGKTVASVTLPTASGGTSGSSRSAPAERLVSPVPPG
jgi:hypothetical protein